MKSVCKEVYQPLFYTHKQRTCLTNETEFKTSFKTSFEQYLIEKARLDVSCTTEVRYLSRPLVLCSGSQASTTVPIHLLYFLIKLHDSIKPGKSILDTFFISSDTFPLECHCLIQFTWKLSVMVFL